MGLEYQVEWVLGAVKAVPPVRTERCGFWLLREQSLRETSPLDCRDVSRPLEETNGNGQGPREMKGDQSVAVAAVFESYEIARNEPAVA